MNFRGIRKVNENIVQNGRALLITSKDVDSYKWSEIPDGSLFVDYNTGEIKIKITGETDWVPYNQKMDGTICIAKDSMVKTEVFTVVTLSDGVDENGDDTNTFTYEDENGEYRHGEFTKEGYYVFTLEKGLYAVGRNYLEVTIDDVLHRSAADNSIVELSECKFAVTESLEVGHKITAKYIQIMRIGNPYPRIFMHEEEPDDSELGDLWIDTDGSLEENTLLGDNIEDNNTVSWSQITGKPTSIKGYGIKDNVSYKGHPHYKSDILDFPSSMPANGGNADTVDTYHAGIKASEVLVIQPNGKIHPDNLCNHTHTQDDIIGLTVFSRGMIIDWYGSLEDVPDGWAICDGTNGTPDLRNKFVVGVGTDYTLGQTGGEASHVLTTNEMPSHNHQIYGDDQLSAFMTRIRTTWQYDAKSEYRGDKDSGWYLTTNTGGNAAHNNLPPYVALYKIMKL